MTGVPLRTVRSGSSGPNDPGVGIRFYVSRSVPLFRSLSTSPCLTLCHPWTWFDEVSFDLPHKATVSSSYEAMGTVEMQEVGRARHVGHFESWWEEW